MFHLGANLTQFGCQIWHPWIEYSVASLLDIFMFLLSSTNFFSNIIIYFIKTRKRIYVSDWNILWLDIQYDKKRFNYYFRDKITILIDWQYWQWFLCIVWHDILWITRWSLLKRWHITDISIYNSYIHHMWRRETWPLENCHLNVKKLPKTWLFFF